MKLPPPMIGMQNYSTFPESRSPLTTLVNPSSVYISTTATTTTVGRDTGLSMELAANYATPLPSPLLPTSSSTILDSSSDVREEDSGFLLLGKEGLAALYTAGAVCVLLAVIVVVLVAVILVMCRRHSKIQRENTTSMRTPTDCPLSRIGQPYPSRVYRSQLSFTGSEGIVMGEVRKSVAEGGGGEGLFVFPGDARRDSDQETLKENSDTHSSVRSHSVSTEKSNNSLPRKNSLGHKYAEIDTVSPRNGHHISHTTPSSVANMAPTVPLANGNESSYSNGGYGTIPSPSSTSSKVIPPPPNMRSRSSSTPHFYYILEKLDDEQSKEGGEEKLKHPSEVLGNSALSKSSQSREGSTKHRTGSLKREVLASTVEHGEGKSSEFCWGDGTIRSRSGSCPSRERRGTGSTKRTGVVSREGSSKSTKSRVSNGGGRSRAGSVESGGRFATGGGGGSREGSVKSRGSRGSCNKKEVWVPSPSDSGHRPKGGVGGGGGGEKWSFPAPHEPWVGSHPSPFSIINENYYDGEDNDVGAAIFDDPKYAAVSVGNLPQLVEEQTHYKSLDPIVPPSQRIRREDHLPRGGVRHGVNGCDIRSGGGGGGASGVGRVGKAVSLRNLRVLEQEERRRCGGGGGGGGGGSAAKGGEKEGVRDFESFNKNSHSPPSE